MRRRAPLMGAFGSQLWLGRVAHETSPRPARSSELAGFLSASSLIGLLFLPLFLALLAQGCCEPRAAGSPQGTASPPCPPTLCARWTQGTGTAFCDSPLCLFGRFPSQPSLVLGDEVMLLPGAAPRAQHHPFARVARAGGHGACSGPRSCLGATAPDTPGLPLPSSPRQKGRDPELNN